ncbi:MAG: hypothetical protein LBI82_13765 [Dysgonamonadaceae bacterium]|jgi:hypothetical protein|nr:hypothetical protein [Dysgonamonadaceae bacterium]
MENIGEYLPLIIIAFSLIYSLVRKGRKKAEEEEISKTKLPKSIPQRDVVLEPQVKSMSQTQTVTYTQPSNKNQPQIFKSSLNNEQSPTFMGEITDGTGISFDFSDIDELRKGIIYAEIFNRKY